MRRLLAIAALALSACGPADQGVRVLAASSLTDAFTEIARAFEDASPGNSVSLSFAGSSSLREQVLDGIGADVVAVAAPGHLAPLTDAGLLGSTPAPIATNVAVIAVPAANRARVTAITDLVRTGVLVGVCADAVPCGALANAAFDTAAIEPSVATREPNVRSLVAKVAAGELDAGIVYRTDVLASGGDLKAVEIDDPPATVYLAAALSESSDPGLAARFVDFVLSPPGQAILARHGFGPAP